MRSEDVKDAINYWTKWTQDNGNNNYEIAILKIWIKFERYLGDVFFELFDWPSIRNWIFSKAKTLL